jgi:hypothetical protein
MKKFLALLAFCSLTRCLFSQDPSAWLSALPQAKDYVQKRASSYDRTGGNADFRALAPGETFTVLDESGPGLITHLWFTIASDDPHHLKALVLRMYWDGESAPSVETPIGDFFGLGLGDYYLYQSLLLSVGSDKGLNSFFPMTFQKHARITVTNDQAPYRTADAKPSREICRASPQDSRMRNSGCNFRTTGLLELPAILSISNSAASLPT